MRISGLASPRLDEMLRPKEGGVVVNPHIVPATAEPQPDFDAMQKLIAGKSEGPTVA